MKTRARWTKMRMNDWQGDWASLFPRQTFHLSRLLWTGSGGEAVEQ